MYPAVVEIALVEMNSRGPGMYPRLIACLIPTSPYPAPSVSTSRNVVNPCSRARLAATPARITVTPAPDCATTAQLQKTKHVITKPEHFVIDIILRSPHPLRFPPESPARSTRSPAPSTWLVEYP